MPVPIGFGPVVEGPREETGSGDEARPAHHLRSQGASSWSSALLLINPATKHQPSRGSIWLRFGSTHELHPSLAGHRDTACGASLPRVFNGRINSAQWPTERTECTDHETHFHAPHSPHFFRVVRVFRVFRGPALLLPLLCIGGRRDVPKEIWPVAIGPQETRKGPLSQCHSDLSLWASY